MHRNIILYANYASVSHSTDTVTAHSYLIDDVQGALEQVPHLPVGLALGGDVLCLPHQIRHHLLPVGVRVVCTYIISVNSRGENMHILYTYNLFDVQKVRPYHKRIQGKQ